LGGFVGLKFLLSCFFPSLSVFGTEYLDGVKGLIAWENVVGKMKKDWQKEIYQKGYIQMSVDSLNKQDSSCEVFGNGEDLLPIELASKGLNFGRKGDWTGDKNTANTIHFINVNSLDLINGQYYKV
jgi:hypothetical protein